MDSFVESIFHQHIWETDAWKALQEEVPKIDALHLRDLLKACFSFVSAHSLGRDPLRELLHRVSRHYLRLHSSESHSWDHGMLSPPHGRIHPPAIEEAHCPCQGSQGRGEDCISCLFLSKMSFRKPWPLVSRSTSPRTVPSSTLPSVPPRIRYAIVVGISLMHCRSSTSMARTSSLRSTRSSTPSRSSPTRSEVVNFVYVTDLLLVSSRIGLHRQGTDHCRQHWYWWLLLGSRVRLRGFACWYFSFIVHLMVAHRSRRCQGRWGSSAQVPRQRRSRRHVSLLRGCRSRAHSCGHCQQDLHHCWDHAEL